MPAAISVVMPVFNAEKYLDQAVESILQQSFEDFELIIIDDGSTDNSKAVIEKYLYDQRIVFESRANKGIIETANQAASIAKGKYIARMDADDVCHRERLREQFSYLESNPEVVAVGTSALLIDEDNDEICVLGQWFSHKEIDGALLKGRGAAIINPSSMLRRKDFLSIGGYSSEYPSAEDTDLWLRLGERGKLANLPEVLISYRQHLESIGYAKRNEQIDSTYRAVRAAYYRRGLDTNGMKVIDRSAQAHRKLDVYTKWAWWAFKGRNMKTSRKYAFKALRLSPLSFDVWKLVFFALKGKRA